MYLFTRLFICETYNYLFLVLKLLVPSHHGGRVFNTILRCRVDADETWLKLLAASAHALDALVSLVTFSLFFIQVKLRLAPDVTGFQSAGLFTLLFASGVRKHHWLKSLAVSLSSH